MLYLLFKSVFSIEAYYALMQRCFDALFGKQQMLHYPLYREDNQNLLQGQMNFTDFCLSNLPPIDDKDVLDVGCGNGVQTIYIYERYQPKSLRGVDINPLNVNLAEKEKAQRGNIPVHFAIDDSQELSTVKDNQADIVLCIESAFHYPDKKAFLRQVKRVLKPGGYFLIADLLKRKDKPHNWWEKKVAFNNWPYNKYEEEFANLDLDIITDRDFTNLIISGFENTANWFKHTNMKSRAGYYIGKFYAWCIIRLYKYQLKHSHQYQLFVGRKKPEDNHHNVHV